MIPHKKILKETPHDSNVIGSLGHPAAENLGVTGLRRRHSAAGW
jgi:hypothetical protein